MGKKNIIFFILCITTTLYPLSEEQLNNIGKFTKTSPKTWDLDKAQQYLEQLQQALPKSKRSARATVRTYEKRLKQGLALKEKTESISVKTKIKKPRITRDVATQTETVIITPIEEEIEPKDAPQKPLPIFTPRAKKGAPTEPLPPFERPIFEKTEDKKEPIITEEAPAAKTETPTKPLPSFERPIKDKPIGPSKPLPLFVPLEGDAHAAALELLK